MLIRQSESTAARRTVFFTAVNTSDDSVHTSTILAADIKLSKAGDAEASATNNATHLATGLHKLELTAAECDTLGEVSIRLNKTGVYNDVRLVNVVAFNPYASSDLGLSNLDAAMSSRLASANYSAPSSLLTFTDGVETGLTVQGAIRLVLAAVAGRRSGVNTGVELMRDYGNSKSRITMTFDSSGNTTAVTYDAD
jgi:hypothetical protein